LNYSLAFKCEFEYTPFIAQRSARRAKRGRDEKIETKESTMNLTPKDEFNLAAKTVAEAFEADFPEAQIDTEYTETGYADLNSEVQAVGDWKAFHAEVERKLNEMRG
jgi:hypothetical protein